MAASPLAATTSTSVCVRFPPGHFPRTLDGASSLFAPYGDVARIDVTLGSATGCILVTFFDVRAAERVVGAFPGAEFFAPASHDFRAVSISAALFAESVSFSGFQSFGELANVFTSGEDMVVEFYDMRAAQRASLSLPESKQRQQPFVGAGADSAHANAIANALMGGLASGCGGCNRFAPPWANGLPPCPNALALPFLAHGCFPQMPSVGAAGVTTAIGPRAVTSSQLAPVSVGPSTPTPKHKPALDKVEQDTGSSAQGTPLQLNLSRGDDAIESESVHSSRSKTSACSRASAPSRSQSPGRPVREKVNSKDLTKFEIVAESIVSGKDTRTTVMVRNIPKVCSREAFVELLGRCDLASSYSFFYMPFDKRRNIHCGFAFVNFKSPLDVLVLHNSMQTPIWRGLGGAQGGTPTPPAVSYARLQGQEQLMKHFSLSAVMYDNDARKRPLFFRGGTGPASEVTTSDPASCVSSPIKSSSGSSTADTLVGAVSSPTVALKVVGVDVANIGMEPRYIPLPPSLLSPAKAH
eukprot:TRINITY_DN33603_c0_g1_i1.p1 TRINITY_DN33603_c0_g1~~TRINITY_DN33603_c0_g1_i1.p1  ORF type:complete len:525 (+),score=92.90 TRINITY_DN33603_c0_g1_i1:89-1663(+)